MMRIVAVHDTARLRRENSHSRCVNRSREMSEPAVRPDEQITLREQGSQKLKRLFQYAVLFEIRSSALTPVENDHPMPDPFQRVSEFDEILQRPVARRIRGERLQRD